MKSSSRKWKGRDGKEVMMFIPLAHFLKCHLGLPIFLDWRTQFLSRWPSLHDSVHVPLTASVHPYGPRVGIFHWKLLVWSWSTISYGSSTPSHWKKSFIKTPNFSILKAPSIFCCDPAWYSLAGDSITSSNSAILVAGLCPRKMAGEMVWKIYNIGSSRQLSNRATLSKYNKKEKSSSIAYWRTVSSGQELLPAMKEATGSRSLASAMWLQMCQATTVCAIPYFWSTAA